MEKLKIQEFKEGTWIESEEVCYPHGGKKRKGRARDSAGKLVAFRAGIADTFFTIPAHRTVEGKRVQGYLSIRDEVLCFNAYGRPRA